MEGTKCWSKRPVKKIISGTDAVCDGYETLLYAVPNVYIKKNIFLINLTSGEESAGMRKSAVVSWYLEQLVGRGQIDTEDELVERKTLVEKVIDRLMYHVSIKL